MSGKLVETFLENAGKAAAGAVRVDGVTALLRTLEALVPVGAAVYCPGASELERAVAGGWERPAADWGAAEVTVEEVLAGIAETGSIVCASAEGRALQASLLPHHHVALLPAAKIHATLDDFFAACAAAPPANLTLITGPSRTADIELTLAIGVHGPERLDVIVC